MILVHAAPSSLARTHGGRDGLGVLSSPRRFYPEAAGHGFSWAADNDAYLAWDADRYEAMLQAIAGLPGCLFVVAPDTVADAAETLRQWAIWEPRIRMTGQPAAFVAQDGIEEHPPPWNELDALFIGGTTDFKLGPVAAAVARQALRLGKHLHMGRVNSRKRLCYARSIGCHSVDGTGFSRFRNAMLSPGLVWAGAEQLWPVAA